MLKSKLFCMMILICTILAGCSSNSLPINTGSAYIAGVQNDSACFISIESYDQYLVHIQEAPLPSDFLSYEEISHLGEFKSFVAYRNPITDIYSEYHYSIIDSSGIELFFSAFHYDKFAAPIHSVTSEVDLNNMRVLNSEEQGGYLVGELQYYYIQGKLNYLEWKINDVTFQLDANCKSTNNVSANYPVDKTTVFGQLLDIQDKTAEEIMRILLGE